MDICRYNNNTNISTPPPHTHTHTHEGRLLSEDQVYIITLVRVISAVAIFSVHIHDLVAINGFSNIAKYGQDGLFYFYILSGLLIMESYATKNSLKDYWRKRFARTLPSYYFILLIIVVFNFKWAIADPFAIPRAILMLQYIAPPTVSYEYCSMFLSGVLTIFMMFYITVPFISKWVKSLENAFVLFWVAVILSKIVPKFFSILYGGFCDSIAVSTMSGYLVLAATYFAGGVMIYFGLKENKKWQLLTYCAIIFVLCNQYDFFAGYARSINCIIIVTALLCFPIKLGKLNNLLKLLNRYTMGLFLTHLLCIKFAEKIAAAIGANNIIQALIAIVLSCISAVLLYHFIEVPGAKLVNRLMKPSKI